jgi:transcriptional regulator with XRE-family HTH domain
MTRRDPNYVDAHVGSRVRMRRQLIGMSQEKLGDLLGITFQQVQKYERGANRVSASRLHHMSKVLGVAIQFFFDGLPEERDGFAEAGSNPLLDAAASPEGIQLNRIFAEVADANKRKLIVAMAKTIADQKQ